MKKTLKSPFRWAGSKAKLTSELFNYFKDADTYIEPFLGSGIVLFRLIQENKYKKYIVNDINESIIAFYYQVKNYSESLIMRLELISDYYNQLDMDEKSDYYYQMREKFNQDKSNYVLFWCLMKTGFNGLYRENKKGEYNVPFGKKDRIKVDADEIREISKLIQNVDFYCMDYRIFLKIVLDIKDQKMIYCDPPYVNSQNYYASAFKNNDFALLIEKMYSHYCAISDVDSKESNEVYKGLFKVFVKDIKRVINIASIQEVREVLFINYDLEGQEKVMNELDCLDELYKKENMAFDNNDDIKTDKLTKRIIELERGSYER